jgi:flagellar basal-body rod protein FlgC
MAAFDSISIAGTGLYAHRKWLDAVSDNIANINTVNKPGEDAYQAKMVDVQAFDYGDEGGVRVAGVTKGSAAGRMVYEPDNPDADGDGYVKYPDIDLGDQMTQMMMAQRGYQANISTIKSATEAYQQALQLGKG